MKEALDFFLDNEKVRQSADAPDEGIDYIFMLDKDELEILAEEWNSRDDDWKSAVAYLTGNLPLEDCQKILLKGLNESNSDIFAEALLSLYQSVTETENPPDIIPADIKLAALKALEKTGKDYPELAELETLLKNP